MKSPVDWLLGKFSADIGMDLGTANTLVSVRGQGIVLDEPSVVAVKRGTNRVLMNGTAVGETAKQMLGKAPGSITAVRPLKNGVIADFEITEAMIRYFIRKANASSWVRPRVLISVPSGITAVEKRAVINCAERAGARKVFLIKEPLAAGLGVHLPINEPRGHLIVDVGGGTTEVAVLCLASIVEKSSIRIAGDEMDQSVVQFIRKKYNLLIGEQTAERIKIQIGSAYPTEEEYEMEIRGRDLKDHLPRKTNVTSEEIREALQGPVKSIIQSIRNTLEQTPPEISADLVDTGITLTGGGVLLRGMDEIIAEEIKLPVAVAADPRTAVARGIDEILDQLDVLHEFLETAESE
jgi:rod shape-determining protein MreB